MKNKGKIIEVFDSVQGEGIYLGEKQLFVRFYGCNLNCQFCDTKITYFVEYEPEELLTEIKMYQDDYHSISFTGGEPLLQKDFLKEILKLTHENGYKNYLETNGTLVEALNEVIDYVDIVAMDIKLPTSTGMGKFWDIHKDFLRIASSKEVFLKAIICNTTREDDLEDMVNLIRGINRGAILVLQPNSLDRYDDIKIKLDVWQQACIQNSITTCVIPQIHKKIGVK